MKVEASIFQSCPTLQHHALYPLPGSSVHGIFQARILGCHSLLQGIFLTQRLNSGLWHCRQIIYQLSTREAHKRPINKFQWLKNHLHCTYRTDSFIICARISKSSKPFLAFFCILMYHKIRQIKCMHLNQVNLNI